MTKYKSGVEIKPPETSMPALHPPEPQLLSALKQFSEQRLYLVHEAMNTKENSFERVVNHLREKQSTNRLKAAGISDHLAARSKNTLMPHPCKL